MIPILFEASATTFTTQGIGRLTECTSCICTEERNGEYEIELEYPVDGALFDEITHSRIIVVKPSQNEDLQAFRIYKIDKPMLDGIITINAQHISYQLNNIPVAPFSCSSLSTTLAALTTNSLENNPFTFTTDKTSTASCGNTVPTMCRALLGGHDGSILDVYGGEWHFDNYSCELLSARGADNGVTIRYGKNLIDLEQEENIANTYTGVVPYWSASDSDECVYAPAVEASTAANYPFNKTTIIDFSSEFDSAPTTAELTALAQTYITNNDIGYPTVSLDVNFVNLADTEQYKDIAPLETVSLCDTVTVIFEKLGIEEQAKVVKTEYDVLKERYNSIEIGSIQTSLATTIAGQGSAIEANLQKAREFTKDATGWLTNGAGYVIANKNDDGSWKELLFLDQPTTAAATKVLRINENGIGFASGTAGTFDSWTYYQAWTLDGSLSLGGVNNSYGTLTILDSSGNEIGVWDKDGITISDGTISGATISGNTITGGTISGATISGNTITGGTISGATISGNTITGGTISGATISGNTITGGTISGATISGNTITGGTVSGTTVSGSTVNVGSTSGGALNIYNSSGTQIGVWDKNGISILNSSGVEIFNVNGNQIKYYSPSYAATTYISGDTQGVRVVDTSNEAIMACGEVAVTDLSNNASASMTGGNVFVSDSSGTEYTTVGTGTISVTDGSNETEILPDGVYVNGTKLGTNGYTGTINDVVTELEYDGENFSYTSYNMTFENGVLVGLE